MVSSHLAMLCLTEPSDCAWVGAALGNLDAVLVDHAHCEMKAASNALSLVARYGPSNNGSGDALGSSGLSLARALTAIAREEVCHFESVLVHLERRGLTLGAPRVDRYAAELRHAANDRTSETKRGGLADSPLVDRLLVGAIIEARSCERFKLLMEALDSPGQAELRGLYEELFTAEAGHYRVFVDLAIDAAGGERANDAVLARLGVLAAREGAIVKRLASAADRASVHG